MDPDTSWFVLKAKISTHVSSLKCWYNFLKYLNTNHICNQESHGWGFCHILEIHKCQFQKGKIKELTENRHTGTSPGMIEKM